MAESEAHGISFEIDHYIPQKSRPDLICDYHNLMYACQVCNRYKGDLYPPPTAQADNYRFFKTDIDFFGDHYVFSAVRLAGRTRIGKFTIDALHLNRKALRDLRELRERLAKCEEYVSRGLAGLRKFSIDQLPQGVRLKAKRLIEEMEAKGGAAHSRIEDAMRKLSRSELLDPEDEDPERDAERVRRLKLLESLYREPWRGRRRLHRGEADNPTTR
jgi:hypothetical protein